MTVNGTDLINQAFPTIGPHTPDTMRAAADAIAELWRYLGHASFQLGQSTPADVYDLAVNLRTAEDRAANVLDRLSDHVATIANNADQYGHTDDSGDVESCANLAADFLRNAAGNTRTAGRRLDHAAQYLGCLYVRETES